MTLLLTSLLAVVLTLLSASVDKLEAGSYFAFSNSSSSSVMPLSLGFNLSLASSYNATSNTTTLLGVWNVDHGVFFPILSSSSFNSSQTGGFSLGFYIWCKPDDYTPCYVYMAVCAGYSGNMSTTEGWYNSFFKLYFSTTENGLAVPAWIANLGHPIENLLSASLVVVAAADDGNSNSNKDVVDLQLRDGDKVVWNVSNVGLMEMSDSGYFSIYPSANSSAPVFQSSIVNLVLLEGQNFSVGMQLTSIDSAYSAKMEKGGLVLFMNSMGPQAPPYWIFPFLRDSSSPNLTLNEAVFSAPCNDTRVDLPSVNVRGADLRTAVIFETGGRCMSRSTMLWYSYAYLSASSFSISFLRLESDGRLTVYVFYNSTQSYIERNFLSSIPSAINATVGVDIDVNSPTSIMQDMDYGDYACDVPLACGPLGICTPGAKSRCACPMQGAYFEPINNKKLSLGCKPLTPMPSCTPTDPAGRGSKNSFVELKHTANIFHLTGWTFPNDGSSTVDGCKEACSKDCSCLGLSYQVSTSSCFLITQNISLLTVSDFNATTMWLLMTNSSGKMIFADDYVTHLKVVEQSVASSSNQQSVASSSKHEVPMTALDIGILLVCLVVSLLLGLGGYHLRKRRREILQQAKEDEELKEVLPLLPTRFSYKELHAATKGFSKLLGAGGCGSVYAGTLLDERKVAVKVLEGVLLQGARQTKEFLAEVAAVGRTGHHNVVRLVGFCWQLSHRILVYEYVERGSLDLLLFDDDSSKEKSTLLDWEKRYDIALGVARGLHYLHEECEQPILHFDIKPQNILLSDSFVAKISDFGMSRLMQREKAQSTTVTNLRGTIGYIAPEWLSGTASKKCDIYSFGIVMLEIVAGRKVLDYSLLINKGSCSSDTSVSMEQDEKWHLPTWVAKKREQGCTVLDILDPRLRVVGCGFDHELQVQRLVYTALWCIHEDPAMRPPAATIVKWLESSLPVQAPPIPSFPSVQSVTSS